MPALLDLSNELLYKMIDHIHPDDIINFSLTRKEVHVLAEDALSLHLQRNKVYQNVILHGCHRHSPNFHPLRLIQDICMDWKVGEYPKMLTFECCHYPGHPETGQEEDEYDEDAEEYQVAKKEDDIVVQTAMQAIQGYIEEKAVGLGARFRNPVTMITFNGEAREAFGGFDVESACQRINNGNREAMLTLLLLFVPNVEVVSLSQCTWAAAYLESGISWIAEQNLLRTSRSRNALMNLSRIRFLGSDECEYGEDFEAFMAFAALPSVQTLFADFVEGSEVEYEWRFQPHTSNVTEIILQHSSVSARPLEALLIGIRALRRFTYDYSENAHHDWVGPALFEAHKIIKALLEHASHSLEYLTLTGDFEACDATVDERSFNGCLQGFKVLKEVFLDSSIYVDERHWGTTSFDLYQGAYGKLHKPHARPLVHTLPLSIEIIRLKGLNLARDVLGLLADLGPLKERRLPKLKKIVLVEEPHFRLGRACIVHLLGVCRPIGVMLEVQSLR